MVPLVHQESPASSATASGSSLSPAALLAFYLERAGFPCRVVLRDAAATPEEWGGPHPRFLLTLRRSVTLASLLASLRQFAGSPHAGAALVGRAAPVVADYSEHLHLDADAQVLRIERRYHPVHAADTRLRLVGSLLRISGCLPKGAPLRVLEALRRGLNAPDSLQILSLTLTSRSSTVGSTPFSRWEMDTECLGQLSPEDLRSLARRLGWRQVRPGCFAAPDAVVAPQAFLRGPLLVDRGVHIGPEEIHLGPACLRASDLERPVKPAQDPSSVPPEDMGHDLTGEVHPLSASPIAVENRPVAEPPGPARYFVAPALHPRPVYEAAKRLLDCFVSLFALLLLLPVMILAAMAIKLYDFGPIFFVHEREGKGAKPFGCVKFRTMIRNAEALKDQLLKANQVDGPQFKIAHDPRITPIGRLLRKMNIDELPQLWNVLRGEMSLVGPRPSPFKENQLCAPWREARLSVKPGITGLWQVSRSRQRGPADFQEWILYDTQYVEQRTFWLDLKILLLTVKEVLGRGE